MNRNKLMTLFVTCIFLLTFCISATAKIKKPVIERGMTKEQVTAMLGEPRTASFNEYGDRWMYEEWRGPFFGGANVRIYVMFDVTGKVVGCEERTCEPNHQEETKCQVYPNVVPDINQPMYPNGRYCLSDRDFSILYNKIVNASFDDDKFSVLELMASRIIDLQNANLIYHQFTFDDAKQKAANILQCRK